MFNKRASMYAITFHLTKHAGVAPQQYLEQAQTIARFVKDNLWVQDQGSGGGGGGGTLRRSYCRGAASSVPGE
jgi:hypothetical protein